MDYLFSSRNNDQNLLLSSNKLTNHGNINLSQEDQDIQPPLFLQFPSPFLDDMDTTTILPNLHHHHNHHHISATTNNRLKPKCVRKKRSPGKKDRHSKIHTAQGLRDRRMRLSVHTARKFFDLNDMLGFDKASKTIEWLFAKSQKAIEEVAETLQSDDANQTVIKENNECESPLSACETESVIEITDGADKDANLELKGDQTLQQITQFEIEDERSRKTNESYSLATESRIEARSRAGDKMMIKHIEKPRPLFQVADPNVDFNQSQLGFSKINLDNYNMEESYHFLKHLHLENTVRTTETYNLGNITSINSSTNCSIVDYNKTIAEPPAGWLNSRNTFLGFLGGWDSVNFSNNRIAPFSSSMNVENPISGIISSNFSNFHSQNQGQ